jgi:hypothetical protein
VNPRCVILLSPGRHLPLSEVELWRELLLVVALLP